MSFGSAGERAADCPSTGRRHPSPTPTVATSASRIRLISPRTAPPPRQGRGTYPPEQSVSRALPADEVHVRSFPLTEARPAATWACCRPRKRARAELSTRAGLHALRRRPGHAAAHPGRLPEAGTGAVHFSYGEHGKPLLSDETATGLHFNLSHSHELAVLALAKRRAIGVDVEQVNAERATDDIARRFFSSREWSALRDLPADRRTAAFFRCWTCKEAFIKLIGDGLAFPLAEFDVSAVPGEPPACSRSTAIPPPRALVAARIDGPAGLRRDTGR